MGDKRFAAFTIPVREVRSENNKPAPVPGRGAEGSDFASGVDIQITEAFAEIELGYKPKLDTDIDAAVRYFSSVTPPQAIERKAVDPIRQRFFDMRSLASDRPFARNDSELFRRQAKFMEDFEDDYPGEANLNMYYPYYQHMGYEQLRTYFTWRTKMRKGIQIPISAPFTFLYTYELLSNIGVESPADGLSKLTAMLTEYASHAPVLARYLPKWIKDYHIYYQLPESFEDFVREHNLYSYFAEMFLFDPRLGNRLELWSAVSDYPITESKFYADGNEQLLANCFNAVLDAISSFVGSRKSRIEDLVIYRISNRTPWDPFSQALFQPWLNQPDRQLKLPGYETYYCRNNRWTASLPMYLSNRKYVAEYLVKKTESCLREATKYKQKLKLNTRLLKQIPEYIYTLEPVIEKAVGDFHKHVNRTVVTVDHANLSRIREEALGTLDKLIVPEDGPAADNVLPAAMPFLDLRLAEYEAEASDEARGDCAAAGGDGENAVTGDGYGAGAVSEWDVLRNALSPAETDALAVILHDNENIKAYADKINIMLEVLADGINEKAADIIGDSILEVDGERVIVYDDYKNIITKTLSN